ncbi:MAG: D-2-hydroxyacid dehydrogenase family protein [Alkalilacustris sp.]
MAEDLRIAVLDDYAGAARDLADWSGLGTVTVFGDTLADADALAARLAPFDVLCVMRERTPLPGALLARLPRLRLIVTSGMRNQSIDLAAAAAQGITVCGTDLRPTPTPELTMALILALERRILPEAAALAAGGWQGTLGRDLSGLTLGLVGLGKVGAQVAALGRAFGMRVAAWSPRLTAARAAEHGVVTCDSLIALMERSDVVSVHVLLTDATRGLIGAPELAAMRPDATLINTARGPVVDTAALLAGLRARQPARAGIDVFDREPLPAGDPIRDADLIAEGRLLLTPHLGYASRQTMALFYGQMVEAVRAFAAGAPIRTLGG